MFSTSVPQTRHSDFTCSSAKRNGSFFLGQINTAQSFRPLAGNNTQRGQDCLRDAHPSLFSRIGSTKMRGSQTRLQGPKANAL